MIYLNDILIEPTWFPDGTSQVWKMPEKAFIDGIQRVRWEFVSPAEFIDLAQLKLLITSMGLRAILDIPYLPYARQDKRISNTTTFALRSFAELINNLGFEIVFCIDPHSDRAIELIQNLHPKYPSIEIERFFVNRLIDLVCYPDDGARHKYSQLYSIPFRYCIKNRNQDTGEITGVSFANPSFEKDIKDQRIVIIDDICDGGATFINVAKLLKNAEAKSIWLFVSHGLFTKGIKVLKDAGIERIFTPKGEAIEINGQLAFKPMEGK